MRRWWWAGSGKVWRGLAAGGLAVCVAAGAWAEPADVKEVAERGKVVERHYDFEAAHQPNMSYALFVPTGYDPAKPAPLVVLLHGLYSNPWQVMHYAGIVPEAEKRGYLVVAPYGYNEGGWYGSQGPDKDFGLKIPPPPHSPDHLGALSEEDVLNVLALVRKDYAVDAKRIYLMGHSMGGGGTLYLGMKHRELWAALAPLAPAVWSKPEALADIRTMPIIVVQGDQDTLVKVENTRRWVAKMQDLKMDYQYIEIKGATTFSASPRTRRWWRPCSIFSMGTGGVEAFSGRSQSIGDGPRPIRAARQGCRKRPLCPRKSVRLGSLSRTPAGVRGPSDVYRGCYPRLISCTPPG